MGRTVEEFDTIENNMKNINKNNTILRDHVTLPVTKVEFDAFCERMSRIAHQDSVLCM